MRLPTSSGRNQHPLEGLADREREPHEEDTREGIELKQGGNGAEHEADESADIGDEEPIRR